MRLFDAIIQVLKKLGCDYRALVKSQTAIQQVRKQMPTKMEAQH